MVSRPIFVLLFNVLLSQSISGQIIPIGGGCGCQQLPVQQNLPIHNNCGCGNLQLANLPNGFQLANNIQLSKQLQGNVPCGCVPNNLQLNNNCNCNMPNNLQLANFGNGLQFANGLQTNIPLSQNDLLAMVNGISVPNYQSVLQLSMQALLNQLGNNMPVNCQCGCQNSLAPNIGGGCMNGNNLNMLKALNNLQMGVQNQPCSCSNVPMMNNMNGMPLAGTQEIVLNNNPGPCQSCANPNTMSFTVYH